MSCKTVYLFVIVTFLLFTIVKGSCLEYGHSCWGAHGKRSGSGGKLLRASANIHSTGAEGTSAVQSSQESNYDIKNRSGNNGVVHFSQDDNDGANSLKFRDLPRLKNLLKNHKTELLNRNALTETSLEQQENELSERWHRLFRPMTKSQMENSENELLHQPSKSMVLDENFYYDFQ